MSSKPITVRGPWLTDLKLRKMFRMAKKAGGEMRVAGGAVRDALLKQAVGDIDFATDLKPAEVMKAAVASGFKAVPTGIDHGTVTVVVSGTPFEVTTLRRDVATDGRHAEVTFTDDWQEDALRRDFTINAMMVDEDGKLYDFSTGYKDIRRKRIRFVGEPRQRIREDYLRLLRFFRFAAKYGLTWADKKSLDACALLRGGLKSLSAERVSSEMMKLLAGEHAVPVLKVMAKRQVLKQILPYADHWRVIERLPRDGLLRLFVLAEEPDQLQQLLKLSNTQAKRITGMASAPQLSPGLKPQEQRHLLYELGEEAWRDAVHLSWAHSKEAKFSPAWKRLLALPERWPRPIMPVTGKDLIAAGLKPGPMMGDELRRLEDYWIASGFKANKEMLMRHMGEVDG